MTTPTEKRAAQRQRYAERTAVREDRTAAHRQQLLATIAECDLFDAFTTKQHLALAYILSTLSK